MKCKKTVSFRDDYFVLIARTDPLGHTGSRVDGGYTA